MPTINRDISQMWGGLRILFAEEEILAIMNHAARLAGEQAIEFLTSEYPPETPPRMGPHKGVLPEKSPLQTPKQWKWWWAMMGRIARGESVPQSLRGWRAAYQVIDGRKTLVLDGGYTRTGTLVRSLSYEVGAIKNGIEIAVGPGAAREFSEKKEDIADYAQYVIDEAPPGGYQAPIHRDRWKPMFEILESNIDAIMQTFFDAAVEEMERQWITAWRDE